MNASVDLRSQAPTEPLVSVVTIFHNEERFLEEAVESVLAQTYPGWELLLCDDGSTDGSPDIARRYEAAHPGQVRYLHHPGRANLGMSATRNLGLSHAEGEFVAFLDGDDVWVPEKLTRQVALLQQHPEAAAVYGRLHVWHAWTRREEDLARDYIQPLGVTPDTLVHPPELLVTFLLDDVHTPSGLLFRRSVLEEVGGYEESFRDMHEDGVLLAKICLDWPLYASGEVWYKYRQHPDSCCSQAIAAGLDRPALRRYLEWLDRFLAETDRSATEVADVVRHLLERTPTGGRSSPRARLRGWVAQGLRKGRELGDRLVPRVVRSWVGLISHGSRRVPPSGWAHMGSLRRTAPISQFFGFDRGQPVDRYYIEKFLDAHRADIRGRVLEVADRAYTERFGDDRVERSDVLHARHGNPEATFVGDLCSGENIPRNEFDCFILTQVLPFVWDVKAAIRTAVQALRPGGVLLLTVPGISQIARHDADRWGDYWRFTSQSIRRLFEEVLPPEQIEVTVHGNALSATAFLQGMASQELRPAELDETHPDYEVTICVRAVRPPSDPPTPADP